MAGWVFLGLWICRNAPYGSGTDESIRYVAFAAATNRWAGAEDFSRFGVGEYYYPPLYFLLFAPFFGDEPSFTTGYPFDRTNRLLGDGGALIASKEYLRTVPPELIRLYRTAKVVSLLCGLGVLLCLLQTIRLLAGPACSPWVVLGGVAPVVLLPQFLYYQTLVNNDALVNLLGALAVLCFTSAALRAGRGDAAAGGRMAAACAVAVGLGLLTKQSALAVVPLPAALAALPLVAESGAPLSRRAAQAARRAVLLGGIVLAAGGWWPVRALLAGDPAGFEAQRLAHPWAARTPDVSLAHLWWTLGELARNYLGLFAGALYGIPDWVFLAYLALGVGVTAWLTHALAGSRDRWRSAGQVPLRGYVVAVLAGTVLFNLTLALVYNTRFSAPYGRLLFPTLAAGHALFALALWRAAAGRRPGGVAVPVVLMTAVLAVLFAWTFLLRVAPAVRQPAENIVSIGFSPPNRAAERYLGPVWDFKLVQPMRLPPGRLLGLRLGIVRLSALPQAGTVLHARLHVLGPDGALRSEHLFRPRALGELDGPQRWAELTLETPLDLAAETPVTLRLAADRSWFFGRNFEYHLIPLRYSPRLEPLVVNGRQAGLGLPVAAVYQ